MEIEGALSFSFDPYFLTFSIALFEAFIGNSSEGVVKTLLIIFCNRKNADFTKMGRMRSYSYGSVRYPVQLS